MIRPLVSIIMPVYNGARYLGEAIESALEQDYENKEIIVVNDGSDDGGATEAVIESFGRRVSYIKKENGGVSSALNEGIKRMRGEYFLWLSHDDTLMPSLIRRQIEFIDGKGLYGTDTVVCCQSELMDADGKKLFRPFKPLDGLKSGRDIYRLLMAGQNICYCTMLIPKSALDKAGGFDTSFRYVQDKEYWRRLAKNGSDFWFYEDKLVRLRTYKGQLSEKLKSIYKGEMSRYLAPEIEELKKNFDWEIASDILLYASKRALSEVRREAFSLLEANGGAGFGLRLRCLRVRARYLARRTLKKIYMIGKG